MLHLQKTLKTTNEWICCYPVDAHKNFKFFKNTLIMVKTNGQFCIKKTSWRREVHEYLAEIIWTWKCLTWLSRWLKYSIHKHFILSSVQNKCIVENFSSTWYRYQCYMYYCCLIKFKTPIRVLLLAESVQPETKRGPGFLFLWHMFQGSGSLAISSLPKYVFHSYFCSLLWSSMQHCLFDTT